MGTLWRRLNLAASIGNEASAQGLFCGHHFSKQRRHDAFGSHQKPSAPVSKEVKLEFVVAEARQYKQSSIIITRSHFFGDGLLSCCQWIRAML